MSPTSQRRLFKLLLNISVCILLYCTEFYWVLGISTISLFWRFVVLYLEFRTESSLRAQIKGFQIPTKTYKHVTLSNMSRRFFIHDFIHFYLYDEHSYNAEQINRFYFW